MTYNFNAYAAGVSKLRFIGMGEGIKGAADGTMGPTTKRPILAQHKHIFSIPK